VIRGTIRIGCAHAHYDSHVDPVRARDPDALARFYDRHAGNVREYCAIVCPTELVDEATLVAFADFLGRLAKADPDTDLDDLLWKAARGAAAGRAEVSRDAASDAPARRASRRARPKEPEATCLAMPELLAAYASGEIPRNVELEQHLFTCSICRATASRFRAAEDAISLPSQEEPPQVIRRAWLELARGNGATRGLRREP
jgi:hypothetical protein